MPHLEEHFIDMARRFRRRRSSRYREIGVNILVILLAAPALLTVLSIWIGLRFAVSDQNLGGA